MAMKGFFSNKTPQQKKEEARGGLKVLPKDIDCKSCGIHRLVLHPQMPISGEGRQEILGIGEGPGETEDKEGRQFIGPAGDKLAFHLKKYGVKLYQDLWLDNCLACRPIDAEGKNRTPSKQEIIGCLPRLYKNIISLQPKAIFLFGSSPVYAFTYNRGKHIKDDSTIGRWRGLHFPDPWSGAWIFPIYHPAAVLRDSDLEHIFSRDIENALNLSKVLERPIFQNWKDRIKPITNYVDLDAVLSKIETSDLPVAIDYETTGLKPFEEGHKIVSMGAAIDGLAWAWPYEYPNAWSPETLDLIKNRWINILRNPTIKKIAHNIIFEEKWGRIILGVETKGWVWDSMQASHIIDERDLFTSLDFQVFLHWGYEYGESIEPYKKTKPGSHLNRMMEAPLQDLLEYNALDSLFTSMLPDFQRNELLSQGRELQNAYDLWHDSTETCADIETTGLFVDGEHYEREKENLKKRHDFVKNRLDTSDEAKLFKEKTGKELDIDSNDDLRTLLYELLNYPIITRTTKTKVGAVNVEALDQFKTPFVQDIKTLRKLQKIRSTYLIQFLRESIEFNDPRFGKRLMIFPNFPIHLVRTYRGSSESPNFQNIPQRDPLAKKLVRSGIVPPPGMKIAAADYGAMEVRIIACYFKDSVLIKEIFDGTDPHGEWAVDLKLDEQKEWKQARYDAKNGMVFPLFYGSYYKSIHADLEGRGYSISPERVQNSENRFWKKYAATRKAQENLVLYYKRTGFIPLLWGHRRRGNLDRNKIFNTPIQGSAFHCLLWSLNQMRKIRKEEGWLTRNPAQIHDEMMFYMEPSEEKHVIKTVTRIMTEDIRDKNQFIIVPLLAEWKMAPIDASWYEVEDIKDLQSYLN
jgi:uracil-DNA glycosylase family 4